MLTLKVVTRSVLGDSETTLFSGERISHLEFETNNYQIERDFNGEIVIGDLGGVAQSEQMFTYSRVMIYGDPYTLKAGMWILPHADCFIMDNGKTVDSFSVVYK